MSGNQQTGEVVDYSLGTLKLRLKKGRYLDEKLISGQIFERESVVAMSGLVKMGDTAIDVGANFGYFTLLFSQWVGPEGRVIAFEPTSEYGNRLREHLAINEINNVLFEQLGLSNREAETTINIGECSATCHWAFDNIQPRLSENIRLTTLDKWWENYLAQGNTDRLNVIKVDLDGHEPLFLLGAEQTLNRHRPIVHIEFFRPQYEHAGFTCDQVVTYLEISFGYKFYDLEAAAPYRDRNYMMSKLNDSSRSYNIICLP